MNSGESARRDEAARILGQRVCGTLPLRRSSPRMDACEAMKRCASSPSDISSENSATAFWWPSAAFSAKLAMSADFPMLGLAARMTRLPGWKPPVMWSRSWKPEAVPVIALPSRERCSSLSISESSRSWIERKSLRLSSWATSRIARSAMSTRSRGGASWECTRAWISQEACRRRRSIAFSRTMRAYWRTLPTAGTEAARRSTAARPPTASSWPACLRCSTSVSPSTGSPSALRSSIAR